MLGPIAHELTIIGTMLKSQLKRPLRRVRQKNLLNRCLERDKAE
jgi:hypothetical protein